MDSAGSMLAKEEGKKRNVVVLSFSCPSFFLSVSFSCVYLSFHPSPSICLALSLYIYIYLSLAIPHSLSSLFHTSFVSSISLWNSVPFSPSAVHRCAAYRAPSCQCAFCAAVRVETDCCVIVCKSVKSRQSAAIVRRRDATGRYSFTLVPRVN